MVDHSIRIIFESFISRAVLVQWLKRGCIEELQALTSPNIWLFLLVPRKPKELSRRYRCFREVRP